MAFRAALLLIASVACSGCTPIETLEVEINATAQAQNISPEKTTVCELKEDPAAFNHKLVEVTAFVSRGFEDSGLFDPICTASSQSIWVEIGGKGGTGVMYCCDVPATRSRPKILEIEKVEIPLVDDEQFRQLDRLLEENGNSVVRARMVGRFFSGEKRTTKVGDFWMGFGHMGMSSLFVIQQVISVGSANRRGFETNSSVEQPDIDDEGCSSYSDLWDVKYGESIALQRKVNRGELEWPVSDPKRVAAEALRSAIKAKGSRPIDLRETKRSDGRIIFRWVPIGKRGVRYMVVVSRPYWMTFYAETPGKTIWIVSDVYSICD